MMCDEWNLDWPSDSFALCVFVLTSCALYLDVDGWWVDGSCCGFEFSLDVHVCLVVVSSFVLFCACLLSWCRPAPRLSSSPTIWEDLKQRSFIGMCTARFIRIWHRATRHVCVSWHHLEFSLWNCGIAEPELGWGMYIDSLILWVTKS